MVETAQLRLHALFLRRAHFQAFGSAPPVHVTRWDSRGGERHSMFAPEPRLFRKRRDLVREVAP